MRLIDLLKWFFEKKKHGFQVEILLKGNKVKRFKVKRYILIYPLAFISRLVFLRSWEGIIIINLDFPN